MAHWMHALAAHYEATRTTFPQDDLVILFDIDGTILDMRYMILYVLQEYDRHHNTRIFNRLSAEEIDFHENYVATGLERLGVPQEHQVYVMQWYLERRWSPEAVLEAHRPFPGVLEIIRWFQLQSRTFVGLNTGRPETLRRDTLRCLNRLGKAFGVCFRQELLYMNPLNWEEDVAGTKASAIERLRATGRRVFAMVDNEPNNLKAIADAGLDDGVLLLHATTIFESKPSNLPVKTVSGQCYDLTEFIKERSVPHHIHFVWHGVNDADNLAHFLGSNVSWAEVDVRVDAHTGDLICRHDSFVETPLGKDEPLLQVDECLRRLRTNGRSVKLDLKEGGATVDRVLEQVTRAGFEEEQLWFNSNVEHLQERGFGHLRAAYPRAILQCPVGFLAPLVLASPATAQAILNMLAEWGINRYSLGWFTPNMREVFKTLDAWGLKINIYDVPDLEAFLQATLLGPVSITADFNFPKWQYYGRGSGRGRVHHDYSAPSPAERVAA